MTEILACSWTKFRPHAKDHLVGTARKPDGQILSKSLTLKKALNLAKSSCIQCGILLRQSPDSREKKLANPTRLTSHSEYMQLPTGDSLAVGMKHKLN